MALPKAVIITRWLDDDTLERYIAHLIPDAWERHVASSTPEWSSGDTGLYSGDPIYLVRSFDDWLLQGEEAAAKIASLSLVTQDDDQQEARIVV